MRITSIILTAMAAAVVLICLFTKSWYSQTSETEDEFIGDFGEFRKTSVRIGLLSMKLCTQTGHFGDEECESTSYPSLGDVPDGEDGETFIVFGKITLVIGILAALLLGLAAILIGVRSSAGRVVSILAYSTCGVALGCAAVFMGSVPSGLDDLSPGFSSVMFFAAVSAGIVGAALGSMRATLTEPVPGNYPDVEGPHPYRQPPMYGPPPAFAHPPHGAPLRGPYTPGIGVPTTTPAQTPPHGTRAPVPACRNCAAPTRWVAQYQRFYCDSCTAYQ